MRTAEDACVFFFDVVIIRRIVFRTYAWHWWVILANFKGNLNDDEQAGRSDNRFIIRERLGKDFVSYGSFYV